MITQTRLPGAPLTAADTALLATRAISNELAQQAMLRRLTSPEAAALVDKRDHGRYAGLVIPYTWPGEPLVRDYRLRRDQPDHEFGAQGQIKIRRRYMAPPGSRCLVYVVPGTPAAWLQDASLPILFTEGEIKALSLHGLATQNRPAHQPKFLPLGIPGVWNWRGVIGKGYDATGAKVDVYGPSPDLDRINWTGRTVWILFDTDGERNPQVISARRALGRELERRGANVAEVTLPVVADQLQEAA